MGRKCLAEGVKLAGRQVLELCREPRLYMLLVFVFIFLRRQFNVEIAETLRLQVRPNFWELWPYTSYSFKKQLVVWVGFLALVSDLPRQGEMMISCLVRTKKQVFALTQQIYLAAVGALYFLFLQFSLLFFFRNQTGWANEWSHYAKRILPEIFQAEQRIAYECQPWERFWQSALLFWLALMIVGMIILIFQMYGLRNIGYLFVGALITMDMLLQVVDVPVLHYLSPLTLARLNAIDLGYTSQYPTIGCAITLLSAFYILLSVILYRKLKRYDF